MYNFYLQKINHYSSHILNKIVHFQIHVFVKNSNIQFCSNVQIKKPQSFLHKFTTRLQYIINFSYRKEALNIHFILYILIELKTVVKNMSAAINSKC